MKKLILIGIIATSYLTAAQINSDEVKQVVSNTSNKFTDNFDSSTNDKFVIPTATNLNNITKPSDFPIVSNITNCSVFNPGQLAMKMQNKMNFMVNNQKAFDAWDVPFFGSFTPFSISTKISNKKFYLHVTKKPYIRVENLTYSLYDADKNETIPDTTITVDNPLKANFPSWTVKNAYKNVVVQFNYDEAIPYNGFNKVKCTADATTVNSFEDAKDEKDVVIKIADTCYQHHEIYESDTPVEVKCPVDLSTTDKTYTNQNEIKNDGNLKIFAIPETQYFKFTFNPNNKKVEMTTDACINPKDYNENTFKDDIQNNATCYKKVIYKCYTYYVSKKQKTEYSNDHFAIRPDKFDINFKKSVIRQGAVDFVNIKALDNQGNVTTNYNNSSTNLDVKFNDGAYTNAQYSFDIANGTSTGKVIFTQQNDSVTMNITDPHFADIDEDDTTQKCRDITGDSNSVKVTDASKYWAGVGTGEAENNPTDNTVDSTVRQNVKKDLHFKKIMW